MCKRLLFVRVIITKVYAKKTLTGPSGDIESAVELLIHSTAQNTLMLVFIYYIYRSNGAIIAITDFLVSLINQHFLHKLKLSTNLQTGLVFKIREMLELRFSERPQSRTNAVQLFVSMVQY